MLGRSSTCAVGHPRKLPASGTLGRAAVPTTASASGWPRDSSRGCGTLGWGSRTFSPHVSRVGGWRMRHAYTGAYQAGPTSKQLADWQTRGTGTAAHHPIAAHVSHRATYQARL